VGQGEVVRLDGQDHGQVGRELRLNSNTDNIMNDLKQHINTALDLAQTHLDEGNIEGALICQQGALRQVAALLAGETETTVLEGATVDCDE
jgi:predicted HTH transcriptional regulator